MRRYALLLCLLLLPAAGRAQNAPPILPAGDAAVAGFSGTVVVGSSPEPQRIDKTYINLGGPALRVIGLSRMGGPPQAQLVAAPKTFTVTAGQIGQVFSLTLDDANPPNIYAAATSAYGLPIVVPDADGDGLPDRARRGAPNAAFMPGLFGPLLADGGPGSIWKINGATGAITLFANVILGVPNSGPALGGLAFDRASRQIFVADRDTGMIHRFTLDGVERGRFDHGVQGLGAAGLPPIAFDPRKRLNIESPAFDSGNPVTWAYPPPARRVFGVAVNRGRLYYAVAAGLRIWSVSLLPDGSFGSDARVEVAVPPGASASAEISEILFDDNGDMLVAERGAPTGAYDYKVLAEAGENRVLRFRPKRPDDPPSRDLWFPVPTEYAIGFPPNDRNDNGGIAIGYSYDAVGNINRGVCGGVLWSTGEQLRNARDPAIIRRLQPGGPLIVDGLQGNATRLLRPQNEPPFESYFIDYDDRFDDSQTRGYLGDVVIWRVCGQGALPLLPAAIICPAGLFNVDGICRAGLACPPGTEFSNGCCVYRGCPASYVRIRGRCVPPPMNCKPTEVYANDLAPGHCEAPKCPPGLVLVQKKTANGLAPPGSGNGVARPPDKSTDCPPGSVFSNDRCQPAPGGGQNVCNNYCGCPEGTRLSEDGTCKPPSSCGPSMVLVSNECVCDPGKNLQWIPGPPPQCVPRSQCDLASVEGNTKGCCPPGQRLNREALRCEPDDGRPQLKITKMLKDCCTDSRTGTSAVVCSFSITVTNIGNTRYSGVVAWSDSDPNAIRGTGLLVGAGGGGPLTLDPGQTKELAAVGNPYTPGTSYSNCAALVPPPAQELDPLPPPDRSRVPSPDISCVSGNVPTQAPQCPTGFVAAPPACPPGMRRGFSGQCFFVDPGCQGPNCRPVVTGCPGGVPRNSDGNCPTGSGCPGGVARNSDGNCPTTTTGCTGGKIFTDNACRCPYPTTENAAGKCVKSETTESKKTKVQKRRKPSPNSDNPPPSGGSPGINIQIGPGFPGGGGGGGRRMPTPTRPQPPMRNPGVG